MSLIVILSVFNIVIIVSILAIKIAFLALVFTRTKKKSVIAYLIYIVVTSFPFSFLNNFLTQLGINKIQSQNGLLWLGETESERITNLLYLLRVFNNLISFIGLILFIWLISSLIKRNSVSRSRIENIL